MLDECNFTPFAVFMEERAPLTTPSAGHPNPETNP